MRISDDLEEKIIKKQNKKLVLLIDELESVITLNDKVGVFNIIKG